MSSSLASRALWRAPRRLPGRIRFESTTTTTTARTGEVAKETATKAQAAASTMTSKASEGLSRVSSTAGPAISGAAKGLGNTLSRIGGRTARVVAFVERQIPPTLYYARVGMELAKLVFHGQKMSPPSMATFQTYYQTFLKSLRNPNVLFSHSVPSTPTNMMDRIRGLTTAQWAAGGVVAAEVLGFFTVGEMVGKMKLIGYKGDTAAQH